MKVSWTLVIDGVEFKIELIDGYKANTTHLGEIWFDEARIGIDSDLPTDRQMDTLFHELGEAVLPAWKTDDDDVRRLHMTHAEYAEFMCRLFGVLRSNGLLKLNALQEALDEAKRKP